MSDTKYDTIRFNNIRDHQIGGETDGMSSETARDLGFKALSEYSQKNRDSIREILDRNRPTSVPAQEPIIDGPSVNIKERAESLIRANELIGDANQDSGRAKILTVRPDLMHKYGDIKDVRDQEARHIAEAREALSSAFGSKVMAESVSTDQEKADIKYEDKKNQDKYLQTFLGPENTRKRNSFTKKLKKA